MANSPFNSGHINIGSGSVYILELTSSISLTSDWPTDTTLEVNANLLGETKDGATVSYNPTYYTATSDNKKVSKTVVTEQECKLSCGLIATNSANLAKLAGSAEYVAGTSGNDSRVVIQPAVGSFGNLKDYIVRFVSQDGARRVTMLANSSSGIELGFQPGKEMIITAEFTAKPVAVGDRTIILDYRAPGSLG